MHKLAIRHLNLRTLGKCPCGGKENLDICFRGIMKIVIVISGVRQHGSSFALARLALKTEAAFYVYATTPTLPLKQPLTSINKLKHNYGCRIIPL